MKIVCGKRTCPGVSIGGAACQCGLALTVGGSFRLVRYCIGSAWESVKRKVSVACPKCRLPIPPFHARCRCGARLTIPKLRDHPSFSGFRRFFLELAKPTRTKQRLFQWTYLATSAVVFWQLLAVLESRFAANWVKHTWLSVSYISFFLLVTKWVVPRETILALFRFTSPVFRLALVFNFLTALISLQIFLATWWMRSLMLSGLFTATWAGAWTFWRFLWPTVEIVAEIFVPPQATFDPHAPQGRTVRMD